MEKIMINKDMELIIKIHEVMVNYIGGTQLQHDVAQDFSMSELNNFIETYFDYFMK